MTDLQTRLFDCDLPSLFVLASGPRSYAATGVWDAYKASAGAVVTKLRDRVSLQRRPTLRGHPRRRESLDREKCRSCGLCSSVCVPRALTSEIMQ